LHLPLYRAMLSSMRAIGYARVSTDAPLIFVCFELKNVRTIAKYKTNANASSGVVRTGLVFLATTSQVQGLRRSREIAILCSPEVTHATGMS
jgi:hypothetical protein